MSEYHKTRLEYLRKEIEAERISYAEIAELQSLAGYIDPGDTLLLEWAGVPESRNPMTEEEETRRGQIIADGLYLRADRAPDSRGDQRYLTQWGSKTALGLYRTMKRAVLEGDL